MKKRDEQASGDISTSAVIGQDDIKKALIWNQINHSIGGVLISGQRNSNNVSSRVCCFVGGFWSCRITGTRPKMLLGGIDLSMR